MKQLLWIEQMLHVFINGGTLYEWGALCLLLRNNSIGACNMLELFTLAHLERKGHPVCAWQFMWISVIQVHGQLCIHPFLAMYLMLVLLLNDFVLIQYEMYAKLEPHLTMYQEWKTDHADELDNYISNLSYPWHQSMQIMPSLAIACRDPSFPTHHSHPYWPAVWILMQIVAGFFLWPVAWHYGKKN